MNEIITEKKNKITSLEIVTEINKFRKEEENKNELRHDNLLQIIRDEFSEEISLLKIQESTYKNDRGREYPMFILSLNQAKQILMRESKFVRKAMINYIEKLEEQIKNPFANLSMQQMMIATLQEQEKIGDRVEV